MRLDVLRLDPDRVRIVVGDEGSRGTVPQIRRLGAIVPVADETLSADELVCEFRVVVGTLESLVGLPKPAVDGLHTRAASPGKRGAEDAVFSRHAGGPR